MRPKYNKRRDVEVPSYKSPLNDLNKNACEHIIFNIEHDNDNINIRVDIILWLAKACLLQPGMEIDKQYLITDIGAKEKREESKKNLPKA